MMSMMETIYTAQSMSTPPETLAALAVDANEDVRWLVARNLATPPEALASLAGDEKASVRRAADMHPLTPRGA